jgi:hypothetical protein
MSNLYSYKGAYPYSLPSNMAEYDINDFILAPEKPQLLAGQKLEWDNANWVISEPTTAEMSIKWQEIRNQREVMLSASDISILRYLEKGETPSENLLAYRQALRDITLQTNPFSIEWPTI